jgi:protein-disulfide isomerase
MAQQRNDLIRRILAIVAVLCLVIMTVVVVRRKFFDAGDYQIVYVNGGAPRQSLAPVDAWKRVAGAGHRIGPQSAPVTVVEFSDFEGPACARYANETLPEIKKRFPDQVSVLFRHWPLRRHRLAYSAARAAECAAEQGRFEEFHNILFAGRDSLHTKPLADFARDAGVKDLSAFERCASSSEQLPAVEADIAEAIRLGGTGTPIIVINGLMIRPPYSTSILIEHIRVALSRVNDSK